ncbi:hypothetical protein FIV42_23185 [Persicimonas caeni]|uniref:Uncharacterized protein n=1 Tax=Persicimonas caeni TaxID=2292766 RepID=A0A4Y6PZD8_PERCE|nr:hypothetical protein [Persicimonas caeni]QDG53539.1 hypothetical protein FIV42_23185 [Persicimonas caeni]QED34760.1 hypothetical protein FRD00_23180 [Persicimonas caeni]
MGSGTGDIARDLARSLQYIKRAEGIALVDGAGLWLLSRPKPSREWSPKLAEALAREELASRRELANLVGAREVKRVTPGWLGRLSYHLGRLDPERASSPTSSCSGWRSTSES